MYTELISLTNMEPWQLDRFLANGWFRMQQSIFTTNKEIFGNLLYDTIWLRVKLDAFGHNKKYELLRKKNKGFRIEIKKAALDQQHEDLFACYRNSKSFERSPSLQWLLLGNKVCNVYDTYMIEMYDDGMLIGAGFFDRGEHSAAGICSIYHPDYKSYSLGKYMIYEKMVYCRNTKLQYFYPGYFVPGYPAFDYKLTILTPAIEYFDVVQQTWLSLSSLCITNYSPELIR
jgi:leucyl-tRNA---protein transferase